MDNSNRLQRQINSLKWGIRIQKENDISCMLEDTELLLHALEEKQERDNPQTLTLAELKEMNGETAWVVPINVEEWASVPEWHRPFFGIVGKSWIAVYDYKKHYNILTYHFEHLGKDYLAYAHKPKEVDNDN